jgi:hypothetical protein
MSVGRGSWSEDRRAYLDVADELDGRRPEVLTLDDLLPAVVEAAERYAGAVGLPWPPREGDLDRTLEAMAVLDRELVGRLHWGETSGVGGRWVWRCFTCPEGGGDYRTRRAARAGMDAHVAAYGGPLDVADGPRVFVVSSAELARCPVRSMLPSHFRDDGTCCCPAGAGR